MMSQDTQFDDLPVHWQNKILEYRREAARRRVERNKAREELAELRSALAALAGV